MFVWEGRGGGIGSVYLLDRLFNTVILIIRSNFFLFSFFNVLVYNHPPSKINDTNNNTTKYNTSTKIKNNNPNHNNDNNTSQLIFRMEDGLYELHRRIPYDYDSEFQDLYEKIAIAVIEGEIGIHDALIIQRETKRGKHTARNGLLLRTNPGRLVLYPFQAATTCVIFFGGDWYDCGVAAICGLVAGTFFYCSLTNCVTSCIFISFRVYVCVCVPDNKIVECPKHIY